MKSENLRGLLDFAGGAAVLIGLVFVGLELRQNTEAVEAASLQSQTDASTEFLLLIATDAELARIWVESTKGLDQLGEIDTVRYVFLSRARWLRMQNAYLQWRRGTLSDDDWSFYQGLICRTNDDGVIRFADTWDEHEFALLDDFVAFVESCWASSR